MRICRSQLVLQLNAEALFENNGVNKWFVIPTKVGIQSFNKSSLDSRLHGNGGKAITHHPVFTWTSFVGKTGKGVQ